MTASDQKSDPRHHLQQATNDARGDIIGLFDDVYQRTRGRLDGLTDSEYFWEPVPGCWTLRRVDSGGYRSDWTMGTSPSGWGATPADAPPFTTIAWRLWHLICCYGGKQSAEGLGVERPFAGFSRSDPAPATAAEAIAVLDRAHGLWQDLLAGLPAAAWREPVVAGPYAGGTKASLVLSRLDEQIHHGAELGVLRDLYLHDRTATA